MMTQSGQNDAASDATESVSSRLPTTAALRSVLDSVEDDDAEALLHLVHQRRGSSLKSLSLQEGLPLEAPQSPTVIKNKEPSQNTKDLSLQLKHDLEARYTAMQAALTDGATYNPLEALRRRADKENRFPNRRLKAWDLTPTEAIIVDPVETNQRQGTDSMMDVSDVQQTDKGSSAAGDLAHQKEDDLVTPEQIVSPSAEPTLSTAEHVEGEKVAQENTTGKQEEVKRKKRLSSSGWVHLPKFFKKKHTVVETVAAAPIAGEAAPTRSSTSPVANEGEGMVSPRKARHTDDEQSPVEDNIAHRHDVPSPLPVKADVPLNEPQRGRKRGGPSSLSVSLPSGYFPLGSTANLDRRNSHDSVSASRDRFDLTKVAKTLTTRKPKDVRFKGIEVQETEEHAAQFQRHLETWRLRAAEYTNVSEDEETPTVIHSMPTQAILFLAFHIKVLSRQLLGDLDDQADRLQKQHAVIVSEEKTKGRSSCHPDTNELAMKQVKALHDRLKQEGQHRGKVIDGRTFVTHFAQWRETSFELDGLADVISLVTALMLPDGPHITMSSLVRRLEDILTTFHRSRDVISYLTVEVDQWTSALHTDLSLQLKECADALTLLEDLSKTDVWTDVKYFMLGWILKIIAGTYWFTFISMKWIRRSCWRLLCELTWPLLIPLDSGRDVAHT